MNEFDRLPFFGVYLADARFSDFFDTLRALELLEGKVYAAMTDAKGSEMTKWMNMEFARMMVLTGNVAHDYEHYGNMSTYMRIKGIVPATSEKSSTSSGGQKKT